jgi:outer membrane protein OmpU
MKKVLLTGAALVAVATSPAMAEGLKLDLAGHAKVYGVYNNNDEAAGQSLDELNIRKETEVHFTGETTLDSGLTVGAHVELNLDRDDANSVEESYIYMSGGWGRVNVGEEDGVAYLLQVSAPSADSNVDGLRQYISTYDSAGTGAATLRLDYDHVAPGSGYYNKVSYMTPVFNGFQAGASYIPTMSDDANGVAGVSDDNDAGDYKDGIELAVRYEGAYEGVGVAFGAGYGKYDAETNAGAVSDDAKTWNAGLDLDFAGFGVGVAYLDQTTEAAAAETEVNTLVAGADYQMGAYKLGVSYLNQETETAAAETDIDRWTAGASYSYGPGMSFRGSVSMIDNDNNIDSTQVLLGTQINF